MFVLLWLAMLCLPGIADETYVSGNVRYDTASWWEDPDQRIV